MSDGKEFIRIDQVIAIHIERYNALINRLLLLEDYNDEDLQKVTKTTFWKARERKIRAYKDCLNTLFQKERILQFHKSGFDIEIIDEKIEIRQKIDFDHNRLSFDEKVELYHLMKSAREDFTEIPSINSSSLENTQQQITEVKQLEEPNINKIEIKESDQEEIPELAIKPLDPVQKLKQSLAVLAAKKFKEAGGTLTEEEEHLLK